MASELWHQKPGPRAPRPAKPLPAGTKEIVNGLERREIILGAVLCVIDAAFALIAFFYSLSSHNAKVHGAATEVLIAGLLGVALMLGGLVFRRRALLGFAAFMVGMELMTAGLLLEAVIYLFFGGWLLFRVMRKQRQDQASGRFTGTIDTGPRTRARASSTTRVASAPKASKRYTPPRRPTARRR